MSKDTVLDMTLPKPPKNPKLIETLDTLNPPRDNSKAIVLMDRTHGADKDLNGFGNNKKEQLLPTAPLLTDVAKKDASDADGEKIEMLPNMEDKKQGGYEDDLEDAIGFRMGNGSVHTTREGGAEGDDGKWLWHDADETDYPDGRLADDNRTVIEESPNVNTYQQKKNLAQGMMDLALLSANANQLRYVLESSSAGHAYYYSSITLISFSIILQIAVGIGLILNSRYDVNHHVDICKADKINNMTVLGVFLVTIVNVFITSFSVAPSNTTIVAN
ncbi:unnamed protein product [Diatraea saccharalis]|uniref:Ninjurin-1 n=1 Tax=Diatraea saccharalis TaxID=40085 RepID=A0A9P0C7E1_9NEOP|nr:unnamed protein product [Diatraea saccharalis]